ncbi:MraY family glycosyltransferase [Treponema sp. C6A8]|uniref:MraY family glycosyltransferase n=1 Tax=Treponema sp. C6A8 TaxID=1410609 RepID=UPI000489A6D1|nr:MraY family glycosyltransferase [Treponema sp. C6A8]
MILFVILAFLVSALSMPVIIKICKKLSLYDYIDSRKIHSGNIPRLGGLGIAFSFFLFAGLYLKANRNISLVANFPVLFGAMIIFIFAFIDDIFNLHASVKLLAQLGACAIVMIHNFRFTQIFYWNLPDYLSYILTFVWILGLINAFNLIDGMDALCGSLAFLSAVTLGIVNDLYGNQISGVNYIFAAAILGFIVFNKPPAKIFMGDCGSQLIGFLIAILPLYPTTRDIEFNKFIIMVALVSLPVFDTIAAVWRRIRDRKPVMQGDSAHLHHKLIHMNYSKYKALILIDLIQFFICVSVVIASQLEKRLATALLAETIVLVTMFFTIVHFEHRRQYRKMNQNQAE